MMKQLFTYGPLPPEKAENVKIKETEIGMMPEGWKVAKLAELIECSQYGLSIRGQGTGKYPILRMNNLINGKISNKDLQFINLKPDIFKKFKLNKGDVLFNRTNSSELVGKTSLFELENEFVFASYLIRLIPQYPKLESAFLNYYLNWESSQKRLKMLASRGVSQSNISATKLESFEIPLPEIEIQREIALILSSIDNKFQAEENKKKALEDLFKTLLNDLMTARIRVKNLEV